MDKYPIIYKYLIENKEQNLRILKHVEKYNEFCNFMIDTYSFRITREEAKNQRLNEQKIYDHITRTKPKKNLIKDFIECWKDIKDKAIKYKDNKIIIII